MNGIENDRLSAFRYLYETNVSSLTQFASRYTDNSIARDIVQDVFFELWKTNKDLDEKTARSYLFTAVRNRCLNYLKHEQLEKSYIHQSLIDIKIRQLDYLDSFEKAMIDLEQLQAIYAEIDRLPDKCKQIFKLSYFEDKSNQEIADILKLSIRTVEHQLYLGLKTLRKKLSNRDIAF